MTLPTHAIMGLIIGKLTGNYFVPIAFSVLPDSDHIVCYANEKLFNHLKHFWTTLMSEKRIFGTQRSFLHNIPILVFLCFILYFFVPWNIFIMIALAFLGHIILDCLDNSDYYPFDPYRKINMKGPIKYASYQEVIFGLCLLAVYFII